MSGKVAVVGELLLLACILGLAYVVWTQQDLLVELAREVDRLRPPGESQAKPELKQRPEPRERKRTSAEELLAVADEIEKEGLEGEDTGAGEDGAVPELRRPEDDPGQGAVPEPGRG